LMTSGRIRRRARALAVRFVGSFPETSTMATSPAAL
jgi:hypothetical protein